MGVEGEFVTDLAIDALAGSPGQSLITNALRRTAGATRNAFRSKIDDALAIAGQIDV
jgi:hypothetical protein